LTARASCLLTVSRRTCDERAGKNLVLDDDGPRLPEGCHQLRLEEYADGHLRRRLRYFAVGVVAAQPGSCLEPRSGRTYGRRQNRALLVSAMVGKGLVLPGRLPFGSPARGWRGREARGARCPCRPSTMSLVAAFLRTGAAPVVRRIPDNTAFTFSSPVGVSRPTVRWK
jgi:hypothetical protein